MTTRSEPGRPPAADLSAFDLSRQSPEQLAQSFARWKAQRKRQPEKARTVAHPQQHASAMASAASASDEVPKASRRGKPPEYSTSFSALLEAGSEPTVQRADPAPIVVRRASKPQPSSGHRLKAMSILAGAASLAAMAGGALLELSDKPHAGDAKPVAVSIPPQQMPAVPIAAAAQKPPVAAWRLQRIVDLALMKAPAADTERPTQPAAEPPAIQTASKPARPARKPVASKPESKKVEPETELFVAKPFIPNDAPAAQQPATIATAPVKVRSGDPRPDAIFQQRREGSIAASASVSSGGKPVGPAGAGGSGEVPSAHTATAPGKVASGGSGDPRGEVSGGARAGSAVSGKAGGSAADAAADSGGGDAAAPDGGSASAGAGSGDAGSSGAAGSDAARSNDSTSEDSNAGSTDGEDSESGGVGGAIGGALDAVGEALGGALGDAPGVGKGNPDRNDKDQRN